MTRAGLAYLLHQHAVTARTKCPVLAPTGSHPTCFGTGASYVLQAIGDTRQVALWLGHESTQTTEDYLRVDVTQRIDALKAVTPPQLRPGTFRPTDALIASLRG